MSRQRIAIIGASGSIGTQTLEVIEGRRGWFDVVALAVGRDGTTARALADRYPSARLIAGLDGAELSEAILGAEPDIVVAAATGLVGINATIDALDADRIMGVSARRPMQAFSRRGSMSSPTAIHRPSATPTSRRGRRDSICR